MMGALFLSMSWSVSSLWLLVTMGFLLVVWCSLICRERQEQERYVAHMVNLRLHLKCVLWWMKVGRLPAQAQIRLLGRIAQSLLQQDWREYKGDHAVWMFQLAELLWIINAHATGPPRGRSARWAATRENIFCLLILLRTDVWDSTKGFPGEGHDWYPDEEFEFDKAQGYSEDAQWSNKDEYPEAPWGSFVMAAGGMVVSAEGFDKAEVKEVERMLREGSPEILELQPWVLELKKVTPLVAEDRKAQGSYLKAIRRLTEECFKRCPNRWWPQLFLTAYRADHAGRAAPDVYPEEVRVTFQKYLPPDLFEKLMEHAVEGQHAYTYAPRWRQRAKTAPSAMQHINEVWRTAWLDTSLARTFTWPPDCMKYMMWLK